jgi:hypothetical protein
MSVLRGIKLPHMKTRTLKKQEIFKKLLFTFGEIGLVFTLTLTAICMLAMLCKKVDPEKQQNFSVESKK